jgi:putative FmdB family regulatory protein
MPLYEYRCRECGHRFEILQRMGAGAEEAPCPRCGAALPEKQLSTFATSSGGGGASADPAPGCAAPGGCCGGFCAN